VIGKRVPVYLSSFVVWLTTGIWHGAAWNFIVWGLYFGILLTIEKFFFIDGLKKHKVIGHIYTLFFVAISFVIFSADGLGQAISFVGGLFGAGGIPAVSKEFVYYLQSYGLTIAVAAVSATPLPKKLYSRLCEKTAFEKVFNVLEIMFLLVLMLVSTAYLADGSFNPFLYFRF
jgi:alginate O-acetyltransferase complex protein AlgI